MRTAAAAPLRLDNRGVTAGRATPQSALPVPGMVRGRLSRIGWMAAGCGAVVVFLAVGFLVPLFGSLHQLARLALINGPLGLAYLLASAVVITRHFGRHVSRALAWVREDRPPGEREHEQTLRLAIYAVKIDALAWVIAGALFGVLDGLMFSWGLGALVLGTVWLGGETTCALDYLLYERARRPGTACALAARRTRRAALPPAYALAWAWPGRSEPVCPCSACSSWASRAWRGRICIRAMSPRRCCF
jgi:hypothetical protein